MTVAPVEITLRHAAAGPDEINAQTLVGIVVTTGYTFDPSHTTADDVTTWETTATYTRLTGVGAVTEDTGTDLVLVGLTDITPDTDLTDEPAMGRLCWFLDGATDTDRLFVGSSVDTTGSGNATYTPTYDGGFYTLGPGDTITVTIDGGTDG